MTWIKNLVEQKQNRLIQLPWKRRKCVLRSHLQDDTRAFSHYVAECFSVQTRRLLLLWAGSASSYDGFVLPRPLWGLLMQSARKSSDIKYNRSRKSYRAGMNSFPFELVPFSFNLLLSASSWPETSFCFSSTPEGCTASAAHWPHLCEPNTCSVLQVLYSSPPTLQRDLVQSISMLTVLYVVLEQPYWR